MIQQINDGGPAFPSPETDRRVQEYGMSLRDWFAGQALANLAEIYGVYQIKPDVAEAAYEYADAMLKAREVTK